ncbi:hypothetical protein WMY93_014467 [Mugilogobius chulae]|uniref:Reverse transcriptase domain-containing protein n=1 Tax=Mugilogobius chulae TaxID=88201 RepID=A0AAW0P5E1_9GOBI
MEIPQVRPYHKPKRQMQFRNIKKIDPVSLNQDMQALSSVTQFKSLNESVDYFNSGLQKILEFHAPLKTKTVSFSRSAPWYTDELRSMKTAGRALERKSVASGLAVYKLAYRDHQKAYSKALALARSNFYSNKITGSNGNSKQLFSTINSLLKPPTQSHSDNSADQCNRLMDFFTNKVTAIRSSLPAIPSPSSVNTSINSENIFSKFTMVTHIQVENIIKNMRASTCSLDPLPTSLIKSNITVISPLITAIINTSIQTGQIPSALKSAVIHPHLKKSSLDPENLANYRPISNLPFLTKVLEKVVAAQLHNHLLTHNLYEKFQSGFRSAHSTETALVRVMNDVLMTSDQGSSSLLLLLDLSAAFDTVDHHTLLNRLQNEVGLSGTTLSWFQCYLSGRTEHVAIEQAKSLPHTVTCGVPQGSVLGPALL